MLLKSYPKVNNYKYFIKNNNKEGEIMLSVIKNCLSTKLEPKLKEASVF